MHPCPKRSILIVDGLLAMKAGNQNIQAVQTALFTLLIFQSYQKTGTKNPSQSDILILNLWPSK